MREKVVYKGNHFKDCKNKECEITAYLADGSLLLDVTEGSDFIDEPIWRPNIVATKQEIEYI